MKITEIVAFAGATAFVLTVVYIYGFSSSIDVDVFSYMNFNDYIKFSVCWLPWYLLWTVAGCFIGLLLDRLPNSTLKDETVQTSDISGYAKFLKFITKNENWIVIIILLLPFVVVIVKSFFSPVPKSTLYFSYCFLGVFSWIGLTSWYMREPRIVKEWSNWRKNALKLGAPLIAYVYTYGLVAGLDEIDKVDKSPTAQLEMTSEVSNKKGSVLFALSQYIVFLEQKTKTVDIIPVGQVKNIITIPKNKSKEKENKKENEE